MLSLLQSALVLLACVVGVLSALHLLNCCFDTGLRKRANEVNGWQLGILGTIYAVSLGFMLSDAWLAYQTASVGVRSEAQAASSLYRMASGLPASCADPMRSALREYTTAVVDTEWPSMSRSAPVWQGRQSMVSLWTLATTCGGAGISLSDRQPIVAAVDRLQTFRTGRIHDYEGRLPLMMWAVLIVGGTSVIASSCLLANENPRVHSFHVVSLTILVSLTLLTIADLDHPFEGATQISPAPFQAATQ